LALYKSFTYLLAADEDFPVKLEFTV